jgi:hypothetical protein
MLYEFLLNLIKILSHDNSIYDNNFVYYLSTETSLLYKVWENPELDLNSCVNVKIKLNIPVSDILKYVSLDNSIKQPLSDMVNLELLIVFDKNCISFYINSRCKFVKLLVIFYEEDYLKYVAIYYERAFKGI